MANPSRDIPQDYSEKVRYELINEGRCCKPGTKYLWIFLLFAGCRLNIESHDFVSIGFCGYWVSSDQGRIKTHPKINDSGGLYRNDSLIGIDAEAYSV